jgi:hypothetical protein
MYEFVCEKYEFICAIHSYTYEFMVFELLEYEFIYACT